MWNRWQRVRLNASNYYCDKNKDINLLSTSRKLTYQREIIFFRHSFCYGKKETKPKPIWVNSHLKKYCKQTHRLIIPSITVRNKHGYMSF